MITELTKADFHKCKKLLNDNGQLEAIAIIEGVNPGRVFVDDIHSPKTGLIWLGNNDGFIFFGDENNERFNQEINDFIEKKIRPEALKVGLHWFEGLGNHPKWNSTIEKLLSNRDLESWNQRVYKLQKGDYIYHNELTLEGEYIVVKMSKQLYENTGNTLKNIDFLHDKILEFWSSPEEFFEHGIGYCAIYKDKIVCVCLSCFVVSNVHCISIETLKEHQGKKLAQRVARYYVEECLYANMVPYWDCTESNKPSIAVAENLGFKMAFNYVGYEFAFK